MNYIGSKYSLLPFLTDTVLDVAGNDLSEKVFCDLFAGTGAVGSFFKPKVKKVIANDWEYYSYVLNRNVIGNHTEILEKQRYINVLNNLPEISDGFIYLNYCLGSGSGRQYFSDKNGKKIDAARKRIEEWKSKQEISDDLYFFLLSSLIVSADKRANTAAVYGAFLKHLKKTAENDLVISSSEFSINDNKHEVFQKDANSLVREIEGDILYLDPPYNSRQYGSNYHILNTIAEYKPFKPQGKTGLRDYSRSNYCSKMNVLPTFDDLLKNARFKYIILSYNNEGLMPFNSIKSSMEKYGRYDVVMKSHPRFRADNDSATRHYSDSSLTTEYLHILEKSE